MANEKCPKCGSENPYRGLLKGFDTGIGSRWGLAYRVKAQACLECGYVELYLKEKDVEKLKRKLKK